MSTQKRPHAMAASDPPPPAPHNIFLRHKEHRVFKRRGETKIRISKTPEHVFYHPLPSCTPSVSKVWTSNWRSQLWQDCRIQISSFYGVNSVFDSINWRKADFLLSFYGKIYTLSCFWMTILGCFFTGNVLFKYLSFFNISYIFSHKSWRNHEHWTNTVFEVLLVLQWRSFHHFMTCFVN